MPAKPNRRCDKSVETLLGSRCFSMFPNLPHCVKLENKGLADQLVDGRGWAVLFGRQLQCRPGGGSTTATPTRHRNESR